MTFQEFLQKVDPDHKLLEGTRELMKLAWDEQQKIIDELSEKNREMLDQLFANHEDSFWENS